MNRISDFHNRKKYIKITEIISNLLGKITGIACWNLQLRHPIEQK